MLSLSFRIYFAHSGRTMILEFFIFSFIYSISVLQGLRGCAQAFSSCRKQGLLLFQSKGSRHMGLVVVVYGLSCSIVYGIFQDHVP